MLIQQHALTGNGNARKAPTLISDSLRHHKDLGASQPRQQIRHQIVTTHLSRIKIRPNNFEVRIHLAPWIMNKLVPILTEPVYKLLYFCNLIRIKRGHIFIKRQRFLFL